MWHARARRERLGRLRAAPGAPRRPAAPARRVPPGRAPLRRAAGDLRAGHDHRRAARPLRPPAVRARRDHRRRRRAAAAGARGALRRARAARPRRSRWPPRWASTTRTGAWTTPCIPFAQSIAPTDIRVTGRFAQDDLNGLFAVLHEVGHGLYERQSDPDARAHGARHGGLPRDPRVPEPAVGELRRARPRPSGCGGCRARRTCSRRSATTRWTGSCARSTWCAVAIRIEADESTYTAARHPALRARGGADRGRLAVADVPAAWSRASPPPRRHCPTTAHGVLQDIHWRSGARLLPDLRARHLSRPRAVAGGARATCRTSTRRRGGDGAAARLAARHVHRHGRRWEPGELLRHATGSSYDPDPLLAHLRAKLAEL